MTAGEKYCCWTITNQINRNKKIIKSRCEAILHYKGYLIDLDGTMYRGNERITGAREFIDYLNDNKLPYLFITNNSSATREEVAAKLIQMGIEASPENILTSAIAAANYISQKHSRSVVYMIGEKGLYNALKSSGCEVVSNDAVYADYVIVGIDRELSYNKLAEASLLIQNGATFLSTNKDPAIPTEKGLLPGNGAITAALSTASGTEPIYIGKPEALIMNEAAEQLGLHMKDILMIGDNYLTDIMAGIQVQMDTLMVLTGYSKEGDIDPSIGSPTYIAKNLTDWLKKKT